ncbi:TrmB family transcriptional regulator [Streptomyces omiyaensis]|uniref:TrmB family transcriptional regulator n=1 Tax=Streptomyces omiyaensis TaxID=68247 RepID=A0ABW7BQK4_9ACTN|nr:LuxR family transcriptional regulator [Streptomyces omiyaensis]GGY41876.1 hypothetical protein GCM10010363_23470 [Streptomyces omiyaensis]
MNWPDRSPDWAELGLGPDELKLYEALLAAPRPSSPAALARAAGVPADRLPAALDVLARHGLVLPPAAGRPLPEAVPPGTALRRLVHVRRSELLDRSSRLELLSASVDRLAARFPGGAPDEARTGIEVLSGREAIVARTEALLASAGGELALLDRPPYASSPDGGMPVPLAVTDLVGRGVRVRVVVDREGLDLPGRARGLNLLTQEGVEIRVAPALPTKLILIDGRVSLLPPTDAADPTAAALVVKDSVLHHVLVPLFESVWERAVPIGPGAQDDVTAEDRELLTLLASGMKDEAMARRLQVHVHTVRRRIKRLLLLLGAETRFQAGVQALRKGWLTL